MDELTELEMRISPPVNGAYGLEFILRQPGSAAETRPLGEQGASAAITPAALGDPLADPTAYGQKLSDQVFAAKRALIEFVKACAAAQGSGQPLRLRLAIAPGAPELHRLAWELLCDPQDGTPLSTRDQVLFSRLLVRSGGRSVAPAARRDLNALLAAAGPANLEEYGLSKIDVGAELRRVQSEMPGVRAAPLKPPVTLPALADALQTPPGGYDIFYLVCHGKDTPAGYALYMEDGQGRVKSTPGEALIEALQGLTAPPRLLVTPACESARAGADGAAFAARLADAGLAAVLAVQIPFSMATEARFLPVFFRELAKDGLLDRACAAARRAAADRPDYWAPVLYTALRDGKIWRDPVEEKGAKYQVTVTDSKGVVVGDDNTVTQNFD